MKNRMIVMDSPTWFPWFRWSPGIPVCANSRFVTRTLLLMLPKVTQICKKTSQNGEMNGTVLVYSIVMQQTSLWFTASRFELQTWNKQKRFRVRCFQDGSAVSTDVRNWHGRCFPDSAAPKHQTGSCRTKPATGKVYKWRIMALTVQFSSKPIRFSTADYRVVLRKRNKVLPSSYNWTLKNTAYSGQTKMVWFG